MKKRLIKVAILYSSLFLLFIGYYIFASITDITIPCIFRELTGYQCPGCGLTHLFFDLLNFRFKDAFNDNQFVFILLPFLIAFIIYKTYLYIHNKKDEIISKIPLIFKIALLIAAILFGIIRNF